MLSSLFTIIIFLCCLIPNLSFAANNLPNLTNSSVGYVCIGLFVIAYLLVISEEFLDLRKSKGVVLMSGLIWGLVAWQLKQAGLPDAAGDVVRHNLLEYTELFLFLLVAMTYVNVMEERNIFSALRVWLVHKGLSFRQLFWITSVLALFISPIADNLTTALLMCSVIIAVGGNNQKFVNISCIAIVVAANAGGAFSPFGDITTLMVWQKEILPFQAFFHLFIPAMVNFLVPAACMHFAIPKLYPKSADQQLKMKTGAITVMILFILTIVTAVIFRNYLYLPPALGMMTGLGYLKLFAYYLKCRQARHPINEDPYLKSFNVLRKIQRVEWDTLFFFYGILFCVAGLSTLGYLHVLSHSLYTDLGQMFSATHAATPANIIMGLISAIIDNIPVMFAVLTMHPDMSTGQWLLVTLTTGVGGSLLSVGSAAGVALMGQAKGRYTFLGHLKWSWAVLLGYFASVLCHIVINANLF